MKHHSGFVTRMLIFSAIITYMIVNTGTQLYSLNRADRYAVAVCEVVQSDHASREKSLAASRRLDERYAKVTNGAVHALLKSNVSQIDSTTKTIRERPAPPSCKEIIQ